MTFSKPITPTGPTSNTITVGSEGLQDIDFEGTQKFSLLTCPKGSQTLG